MSASGAVALTMCATSPAELAVGPLWYFKIVVKVQAASAAVSGLPSDHFAPLTVWNVQTLPPSVTVQLVAKSGTSCTFAL